MFTVALVIIALPLAAFGIQIPLGHDFETTSDTEEWISELINQMSLAELALQLDMFPGDSLVKNGNIQSDEYYDTLFGQGSIPGTVHDFYAPVELLNRIQDYALNKTRIKIPILVIEECLHGVLFANRTVFPQAIALAATFNTAMVEQVGRAIGREARASGVHFCLSPVLDLARDPRWGRVEETYGECPFLTSQMAVAMVRGMQARGNLNSSFAVVAEMKHFAAHGSPYGGRNTAPVKEGQREVYSTYLVPFREAVVEAGARGVMAAYNEVDGIPNAANYELLTNVLRKTWGFKGIVVSDLGAISMLKHTHFVAADASDAIRQFHEAGGNIQFYDYPHDTYVQSIKERAKRDTK
jgi:beta-glucosidase